MTVFLRPSGAVPFFALLEMAQCLRDIIPQLLADSR